MGLRSYHVFLLWQWSCHSPGAADSFPFYVKYIFDWLLASSCHELTRDVVRARQYKLVSDERNVNPFPASFLDAVSNIRLYRCTIDGGTFIRICSSFKTELEMTGIMQVGISSRVLALRCTPVSNDIVQSFYRGFLTAGRIPLRDQLHQQLLWGLQLTMIRVNNQVDMQACKWIMQL